MTKEQLRILRYMLGTNNSNNYNSIPELEVRNSGALGGLKSSTRRKSETN